MKLSEAINYATSHDRFLEFLREKNIDPNSAHEILAKITNVTGTAIEHRIYVDYGRPGESINDIRVIVDYNINSGNFVFIQIDNRSR
jgi:hypothetical protein